MRCPACNDRDKFVNVVRKWGVFVPDADITWESDSQMDVVQNRCDALICACPSGREHLALTGNWRLLDCYTCGSSGCHYSCNKKRAHFVCTDCVMENNENHNTVRIIIFYIVALIFSLKLKFTTNNFLSTNLPPNRSIVKKKARYYKTSLCFRTIRQRPNQIISKRKIRNKAPHLTNSGKLSDY